MEASSTTIVSTAQPPGVLCAERCVLLLCLVLLLTLSFAPFNFVSTEHGLGFHAQEQTFVGIGPRDLLKSSAHFLAFLLFGGLIAAVNERSILRIGFARFVLLVGAFCAALEFTQAFVPSRHARVMDLILNLLGVCLGAAGVLYWSRTRDFSLRLRQSFRSHAVSVLIAIILIAAGIGTCAAAFPVVKLTSLNWDRRYHLLIGNEVDNSRPWLGEIQSIAIYGQALTSEQVADLYRDAKHENPSAVNPLVEYDFRAGDKKVLLGGSLKSDSLSVQDPDSDVWTTKDGTALLRKPVLLESKGSATTLTQSITSSSAFSVEAWIRPMTLNQHGPARIVGVSSGIWMRNFTLGQEGSNLIFRVRNGINGPNGSNYALWSGYMFPDEVQQIVAVYDHGVSTIFRNGYRFPPVDLRDPLLYLHLGTGPGSRAAAGILTAVAIALPVYAILSFRGPKLVHHMLALVAGVLAATGPYAMACLLVGGPWYRRWFLYIGTALLAAYFIGSLYVLKGTREA